eukprot:1224466-Pyramimonas_sp.AAC.2
MAPARALHAPSYAQAGKERNNWLKRRLLSAESAKSYEVSRGLPRGSRWAPGPAARYATRAENASAQLQARPVCHAL